MLYKLAAKEEGNILTVTTCPSFGLRPQKEISARNIAKVGGMAELKVIAESQAAERGYPLGFVDHNGQFIFKTSNWPKEAA